MPSREMELSPGGMERLDWRQGAIEFIGLMSQEMEGGGSLNVVEEKGDLSRRAALSRKRALNRWALSDGVVERAA